MRNLIQAPLALLLVAGCATGAGGEDAQANILIIVADDLGFLDLGVLGSEIRTPNLDRLARSGLLLTNFQVSPACSPTRAMLLSGTDTHPAGLGTMSGEWGDNQEGMPGYEGFLSDRVVSVASLLRDAGYHTSMAGKWHLGGAEGQGPDSRGFERSFALIPGGASHFSDATWLMDEEGMTPYREDGRDVGLPEDFYSSEHYTDKLIEYMGEGLGRGQPFFAYAAYTSPHWPLQVPDEDLDLYSGAYDEGYDVLRARRFEAAVREGIVPEDMEPPTANAFAASWESLSPFRQRIEAREMELYASMVENLDRHIGRLLRFLEEAGELDKTFVMFFSDNGPEGNPIGGMSTNETWIPTRFDNSYQNMGRLDSYVFYGPGWAQASVAPFRWFKTFPTEGGVRVPAIVRHGALAAGERSDEFVTVKDVAPTLLALAGALPPGRTYRGRSVKPMQGRSILPFLLGGAPSVHSSEAIMAWELFGRRAVRKGTWKAVWLYEPYGREGWELFNLENDPAESRDLAAERPEKLAELLQAWDAYVRDNGVILPSRDMGYAIEK